MPPAPRASGSSASAGAGLRTALSFSGRRSPWERSPLRLREPQKRQETPSEKEAELLPQVAHVSRYSYRRGWDGVGGGGSTNQQDSISSAGAECCSEFILIHHTDEESLRMKTNPVKIYFTLRSSLIWITPSAALHQQGEATCCRAICCCYLMEKKKLYFFTHRTWQ